MPDCPTSGRGRRRRRRRPPRRPARPPRRPDQPRGPRRRLIRTQMSRTTTPTLKRAPACKGQCPGILVHGCNMLGSVPWPARAACAGSDRSRARVADARASSMVCTCKCLCHSLLGSMPWQHMANNQLTAANKQQSQQPRTTGNRTPTTSRFTRCTCVDGSPCAPHVYALGLGTEATCCVWVKPTRARVASGSGA